MKVIKDPLYGFVRLENHIKELIDTKEFQRLRWIRQLGFAHMVYPSAVHTRFEHSLGSYYLANLFVEILGKDNEEFKLAALLHDIGHLPFSHTLERFFERHENISVKIVENNLSDKIEKYGFDTKKVVKYIKGKSNWGKLISGEIDVDRLDYLNRDAYYTGTAYGIIDYEAIIRAVVKVGKKIIIKENYIPAFESLLIGRSQMYRAVYLHKTIIGISGLVRKIFLDIKDKIEEDVYKMVDFEMLWYFKKSKMFDLLIGRKLYKEIGVYKISCKDPEIIENTLVEKLGVKKEDIIVECVEQPKIKNLDIYTESGENIEKISPLISQLRKSFEEKPNVFVFSKKKLDYKKIGKIIENM